MSSPSTPVGSESDLDTLFRRINAIERRLDQLEVDNEARTEWAEGIEAEIQAIKSRTDLLQLVEDSDDLDGEQRSVVLVQHLHKKAARRRKRDEPAKASLTRDQADEALRFPDVDRSTVYDDMKRAVRLVDNKNVLRYVTKTGGNSRLELNLEAGEVPNQLTGADVNGGE